MKLNKTIKANLLVQAMENIFGKDMEKFNNRCQKLVEAVMPIHEKQVGPWEQMDPHYINKEESIELFVKPEDSATKAISTFSDKNNRRSWLMSSIISDQYHRNHSCDYILLTKRTIVPIGHYGRHQFNLNKLLERHPGKLRAFVQYVQEREALVKRIEEMRIQLGGLINHCKTVKQLQESWPEAFEQGILEIPQEENRPMMLPANIIRINELAGIQKQPVDQVEVA